MTAAFLATRLGRALAAAGAVLLALVTFGAWQRRQGAKAAQQAQKDRDHEAAVAAGKAGADYRSAGADQRLRDGNF